MDVEFFRRGIGKYQVIEIVGDFKNPSDFDRFQKTIHEILGSGCRSIALDFSQLAYVNSGGLGHLVLCHNRIQEKEAELVFFGASIHVLNVMRMMGLLQMVEHFSSEVEFRAKAKI